MDVLSALYWDSQGRSCPATILEVRDEGRVDLRYLAPDGQVLTSYDVPRLAGPGSWSAPGERQVGDVLREGGPEISQVDDRRWAATGYRVLQNRNRPVAVGEPVVYRDARQGPLLAVIRRIEVVQPRRNEKVVGVDLVFVPSQEQMASAIEDVFRVSTGFVTHDRLVGAATWRGVSHGPGAGQWHWPPA